MKILIISQYMIPMMTPRSFRTFELAKELAKTHDVTVFSLLGNYDYSNIERETGLKIKSIGTSYCGNIDSTNKKVRTILGGIVSRLIGRYILFPQIELVPKVKDIAQKYSSDVDMIISIAKPYAIHWGVTWAKKKCNKFPFWISDCGDPFMGDPFDIPPSYFERWERAWCEKTDLITVPIEKAKCGYYEEYRNKIHVIPQGFDFESIKIDKYKPNNIVTFIFAGNVIIGQRDPDLFLKWLSKIEMDFKFIVYTQSTYYFHKYKKLLNEKLEINDFIPRNQLLEELSRADFLVNIQNIGTVQSPSKLIDYALAKRPILNITTRFVEENIAKEFLNKDYTHKLKDIDVSKYDIKIIAQKFIDLYDKYGQ